MNALVTKRLLTVRHGDYDEGTMGLSNVGTRQITSISDKISPLIKGKTAIILSSSAKRAVQSAVIISNQLGVEYQEHEVLWSEGRHPEDLSKALELVQSFMDKVDVIILVTHYEYIERFPSYFAYKQLEVHLESEVVGNGCMWDLDWETVPRLEDVYPY